MIKFIHTADIHLDSPLQRLSRYEGAPVEQIRNATRHAFENLVHLAISEQVKFVLIAGDLYDGDWRCYNTGLFFSGEMGKLRREGIRVFIVSGNHDAESKITKSLRLPENVKIFSTKKPETLRLDDLGIAVHGQGFHQPAVMEDIASKYPDGISGYFNIGILHTSLTGREGHEPYAPCQVETLLSKHYDYWALGHVHNREVLHEDPWIIFPGNIQGRYIRETGPKGCTLVTVDDGMVVAAEHQELDVLRWELTRIDASDAPTIEAVLEKISEALSTQHEQNAGKPMAARILISGSCKAHEGIANDTTQLINQIRANATDLSGGMIWVEKVLFQTKPQFDPDKIQGPIHDLIQYIHKIEAEDLFSKYLKDDYSKLKAKLPRELFKGDDAFDLESSEKAKALLEDAKNLLTSLLLSGGPQS
ncbi:MAG: DNA repair exonuclease [Nitrospirota bacterium]